MMQKEATTSFYLFAEPSGKPSRSRSTVFYEVETELLANSLCALFRKQYANKDGCPAFCSFPSISFALEEQILLDEELQWLHVYHDPDPGLYDPPPSRQTLVRAQYMVRAREWEQLLLWRMKRADNEPKHAESEGKGSQQPTAREGTGDLNSGANVNADLPTIGEMTEMPPEEQRNSTLLLLFLFAQAYYKILESTISMASWCAAVDVELNGSYLWIIECITNLLENSEELKDFPIPFEPIFPDLFPTTIGDCDWIDMVAPHAEEFLSTVQKYVQSKGTYEPEKGSPGCLLVQLFQPSVHTAIERAIAYNKRMRGYLRQTLDQGTGKHGRSEQRAPKPGTKSATNRAERKYQPWRDPGDACFIIEGDRILFHHDDEIRDLRLKSHSSTPDLVVALQGRTLQSADIKSRFCKGKTKPIQVVSRANERLNASIRKVGFTCLPEYDVEFIRYVRKFDHYASVLPIHASKDEFDHAQ